MAYVLLSVEEQQLLMEWWNSTEKGKQIVQRLVSFISELRVHPESSHADGMVLFYRAASEISYGYAGIRGCIRRFYTSEYSDSLRKNLVMCHSFAQKYSVDTKILLERVAKQINGPFALKLVEHIRIMLVENDVILKEIEQRSHAFFGTKPLLSIQKNIKESYTMPTP